MRVIEMIQINKSNASFLILNFKVNLGSFIIDYNHLLFNYISRSIETLYKYCQTRMTTYTYTEG